MEKIKLSEIRAKFPMYADVNDDQLLIALRKKYYSDIPSQQFFNAIDYDTQRIDPTEGMSGLDKFRAGMGKSFADIYRTGKRAANMVGIGNYDQAAAAEDARLDKPLTDTGAGMAGKVVGDIALTAVPGFGAQRAITTGLQTGSRMLPQAVGAVTRGAAPYVGAAGSGALVGAALSPEDLSGGATTGAMFGAGGEAAGRLASATYAGGKAALEPITQRGRERILRRTLERFSTDPNAVRAAAQNPQILVPGAMPTLAEATLDPGIAQLQRGAMSASPDVASAIAQSRGAQVAAYRQSLDDLAGGGRRPALEQARETTADALYERARQEPLQMTPQLEPQVQALLQRPSMQRAINEARNLASERGMVINDPAGSAAGLMYVDRALSDQIGDAVRSGNANLAGALRGTQEELRTLLDQIAPSYGQARQTYAQMSRPINQMAIGEQLRNTALPPLDDLSQGALARVNANAYANALRNADRTAAQATELRSATMADVLDPTQMATVQGVGQDMARYAAAQELARVPGSPTAQYLGAQNVVRQFLGPLGIPHSAADSMIGRVTTGLLGLPFRMTQSQTEQMLAQALTDPQVAARLMNTTDPRTIAEILRPFAAQAAIQTGTE